MTGQCVCGCEHAVHVHYHAGTYCGRCGLTCPKYRPDTPFRRWFTRAIQAVTG